jgi:hypothetical protein
MDKPNIGDIKHGQEIGRKWTGQWIWAACVDCGKERWVCLLKGNIIKSKRCHSCAAKANGLGVNTRGIHNVNWKDGKKYNRKGYIQVKLYRDDFFFTMADANHYVLEHRLVMAKSLGRCLAIWERVHHKNGDKADNRINNLELTTNGQHITDHHKGYKDGYQKGMIDGKTKQIAELKDLINEQTKIIKLLQWQLKEYGINNNNSLREDCSGLGR